MQWLATANEPINLDAYCMTAKYRYKSLVVKTHRTTADKLHRTIRNFQGFHHAHLSTVKSYHTGLTQEHIN
jgi:hypothetical protein